MTAGIEGASLAEIVREARTREAYSRLGADEGNEYIPAALAALRAAVADVEYIRDHRCVWDSRDFCRVCGADGRG